MSEPDDATASADALLLAMASFRHLWRARLEPWELSPHQARALRTIGSHGPLRSGDLSERLNIAARSGTEVVDALVKRGLAVREPDPRDRRAVQIRLTDEGQRSFAEILDARRDVAEDFFGCLSPADRDQLTDLLTRLRREQRQEAPATDTDAPAPGTTALDTGFTGTASGSESAPGPA